MRINYEFKAGDPMIVGHLHQPEILDIRTWQQSSEYTLEFHQGHATGYPIYIRPAGNSDNSNIPKIDTKNKFACDYDTIAKITNGEKLNTSLSTGAKQELLNIIADNWDILKTLSECIWDGDRVIPGKSVLELWGDDEGSATGQHHDQISMGDLRKVLGGY